MLGTTMNSKKKNPYSVKFIDGKPLDPTSSLNDYFMCGCNKRYSSRIALLSHIKKCVGAKKPVVCRWCKLEFKNRGNLVTHAYHMHGDKAIKQKKQQQKEEQEKNKIKYKCQVCDYTYTERWKLKFHIRRQHFNLWARIPHADQMHVNQVWFERVLNTNLIVEIKKTGFNTLVMKPLPPRAGIKIHDCNKRIDLRSTYPLRRRQEDELCRICLKIYKKQDLMKHMNEQHFNIQKHKCNNCNKTFKRSYVYLQHVCHAGKIRGRKRNRVANVVKQSFYSKIRISSVASLNPVVVD